MPLALFERAATFADRTAIIDRFGWHAYGQLLADSAAMASALLGEDDDLAEARIGLLAPATYDYVSAQWGVWRAGGVVVPLGLMHPQPELEYVLRDADVSAVVVHPELVERIEPIAGGGVRLLRTDAAGSARALPELAPARRAMILYTSGTTSRPKGVVTTHSNLTAQSESLRTAWSWSAEDRILNVLPLHHIHGIVNVVTCALASGALCEMSERFDPVSVWNRLASGDLTLFMAVPTIYARLIAAWEAADESQRRAWSAGSAQLRLMVSGSAALPVSTLETWRAITGHTLLERYGMTEIGMALSNPLHGERVPGHVGQPLPGVEVQLRDEHGAEPAPGEPGEIEVRGPSVFLEYWQRPDATDAAFRDGWFRTGDVATIDVAGKGVAGKEAGSYRILGRSSVDIIKTGGYKVSALEIEETLREHPAIQECAVVGLPDDEWGECVAAAVVLAAAAELDLAMLRTWAKARLAPYKIPSKLTLTPELPRNAMGKVHKPTVATLFEHPT